MQLCEYRQYRTYLARAVQKPRAWPPIPSQCRLSSEIEYSEKYLDATHEYRHVILTRQAYTKASNLTNGVMRLLKDRECRDLGIQQTRGWEHYESHEREPHILLFRRLLGTDPKTGLPPRQDLRETSSLPCIPESSQLAVKEEGDASRPEGQVGQVEVGQKASECVGKVVAVKIEESAEVGQEAKEEVAGPEGATLWRRALMGNAMLGKVGEDEEEEEELEICCIDCGILRPSSRARCRTHGIKEKWYRAVCGFCNGARKGSDSEQGARLTTSLVNRCSAELSDALEELRKDNHSVFLLADLRKALNGKPRGSKSGPWRDRALLVVQLQRTRACLRRHGAAEWHKQIKAINKALKLFRVE